MQLIKYRTKLNKRLPNGALYPALLVLFILIAYLPLTSFQFSLKNDAFIYNFPNKYFFSECLHNGFIPWWNPYLNFGFPLYADPGFAWWQPITWVFGIVGYNPYVFTIEVIFYISIAGIGMYWLSRKLNFQRLTSLLLGAMFACNGFFIGNLQHTNFLTCAAFLPWVVGAWLQLHKQPSYKKVFLAAFVTYLLCTGGHPAIPIGTFYFMVFLGIIYFAQFRKNTNWKNYLRWNITYIVLSCAFLIPAFLSWLYLMPFYERGQAVSQEATNQLGFTPASWISFLLPASTFAKTTFFTTDVSMRNGYISFIGFIVLVLFFIQPLNNQQKVFIRVGILMLLLSLGGWIKELLFSNLPLLKYIRTNGEFRVFPMFCLIISVGFFLEQLSSDVIRRRSLIIIKWIILLSLPVLTGLIITNLNPGIINPRENSIISWSKAFLNHLSLKQSFLIAVSLCLILALLYYWILNKRYTPKSLAYLVLFDLLLNAWIALPVTGVGSVSVTTLTEKLQRFPKGFPKPIFTNSKDVLLFQAEDEKQLGSQSWYDKEIVHKPITYPSSLVATNRFYSSSDTSIVMGKPFIFLKNGYGNCRLIKFIPTAISAETKLTRADTLIILQNYYPGWCATINRIVIPIIPYKECFISIPLKADQSVIKLTFSPLQ
jgi:hypothetical protein